jgi:hypothetical protein
MQWTAGPKRSKAEGSRQTTNHSNMVTPVLWVFDARDHDFEKKN